MERWLEAHSGSTSDSATGEACASGGAVARRDAHGYTLAHWAALGGHVGALQLLLHRGAPLDLSCLGTQGPRPIHWACRKGHTAAVHLLLHAGVSVNAADFKGVTPLMTACMYGRAATAAYLLGMGAATHLTDVNGDAAMHWAAYKAHPDLVRTLIYAGAPAHAPDHFGSTPLHLACISGNVTCVRLLSEQCAGATNAARGPPPSLEARDKNGKTPLQLAQSHRHAEAVALLVRARRRHSRLAALTALLFGGAGSSKGPLLLFVGSVVLWGYPLYLLRCVPLTWHAARLSHYSFIWWNVVMWVSWAVANRRQPGFLPRNSDAYRRAIRALPHLDKWRRGSSRVLARLCHTCRCVRPLRAKHCRTCGRCVAHFDHHCPFIYNCVGLRNRAWFFLFVVCVAINCSYSIYFACYCVLLEGWGALYVLGLAEAGAFCVLGWALSCTAALHAAMNLTTNEMVNYKRYAYLRDARGKYTNPFSRGLLLNLLEFAVCLPAPDPDPDLDLDLDFDPDFDTDICGDHDRDPDSDPRHDHDADLDPGRHV